ncbi:MAG TPA: response regulator [Steroidobacteraceae bacterium]|jgi:CheY-like chemotaxis protein|nr:response regulator [Steroidobacteraceae bacterium]
MGAKRALIVDDSKSARLFLARVLEKYEIDVDSAESAEAAIDYLSENRPDVIFMDHLMPGMDGLQAVQHIKNDPRTATIPIMMYTSQEGELYLGQARALGAVGVLPKQIRPADVSKVLYQLHLVPDRRIPEQASFTALNLVPPGEPPEPSAPVYSKPLTDSALREHFAELRRALVAGIDTQTDRITAEVRALLLESLPEPGPPEPPRTAPPWAWLIASAALAIALLSTGLWWRSVRTLESLTAEVTQLRAQHLAWPTAAGPAGAEVPAAQAGAQGAGPGEAKPIVALVPYGNEPLGGPRLEVVSRLLGHLVHDGRSALVEVHTFGGRFCLVGSAAEGYSLAPEEMPYSRCDVVGNPYDEALSAAQRTPLGLANLIADVRKRTSDALDVQVAQGDAASLAAAYPAPSAGLTAGEWNRAAIANNRIEIRVR